MTRAPRVLLIIVCLFLESCNSDFSVNAPHQDIYVLNCILRSDTSIQYATISKNYFTENGAVPPPNTIEQNIQGVHIQIVQNDSVYVMRDTTVELTNSGTSVQVDCYYVRDLVLTPGRMISIEADLPDGQILRSAKRVPVCYTDPLSFTFPQTYYTKELKKAYVQFPTYSWIFGRDHGWITDMLSSPRLEIDYEHFEGGTYVRKKMRVPLTSGHFTEYSGFMLTPDLNFSFIYDASTSLKAIDALMKEISGSDLLKNNYIINSAVLTISSMDPELTRYFSAYEVYANSATVKLRPTDYSNIQRGKGIFGIYYKYSYFLFIDSVYINSFGYQYDPSPH